MVKRVYVDILKGFNEHYREGWRAADLLHRHLPHDSFPKDDSQASKDWMKGFYDRGRLWMLQHEAT